MISKNSTASEDLEITVIVKGYNFYQLKKKHNYENNIVNSVSYPKSSEILCKSEKPFHSKVTNPSRGLLNFATKKIKSCPARHHDLACKPFAMFINPQVLFSGAQTNP